MHQSPLRAQKARNKHKRACEINGDEFLVARIMNQSGELEEPVWAPPEYTSDMNTNMSNGVGSQRTHCTSSSGVLVFESTSALITTTHAGETLTAVP